MRALFLSAFLLCGCVATGVGDPCVPEVVPAGGFDPLEAYVESSSPQCMTSVCVAYGLDGDPREGCTGTRCAIPGEVRDHAYCSCRCGGDAQGSICACPSGYECRELPQRGSYCLRP